MIMFSFKISLKKSPKRSLHFSRGFSGLVEQVLGQPLDKSEQVSDWTQRPLSKSQVVYAALDAYAVLQVTFVLNYTP